MFTNDKLFTIQRLLFGDTTVLYFLLWCPYLIFFYLVANGLTLNKTTENTTTTQGSIDHPNGEL